MTAFIVNQGSTAADARPEKILAVFSTMVKAQAFLDLQLKNNPPEAPYGYLKIRFYEMDKKPVKPQAPHTYSWLS